LNRTGCFWARAVVLCVAFGLPFPEAAKAILPVTPQQEICPQSHIFVGQVLKATNDDLLHLTFRVRQVLATRAAGAGRPVVQAGDTLTADVSFGDVFGIFKNADRLVTDNNPEILSLFVGNEFLFGMNVQGRPNLRTLI
jgi:hypothetical protein